jgi:hypothetical protein
MFKQSIPIAHEIKPTPTKSIRTWIIFIVGLGAILAPLVVEGTAICYAQWCEIMGKEIEARTPIIDSIAAALQSAHDLVADSLGPTFQSTIHNPNVALPVASVLLVVAMAMLRR